MSANPLYQYRAPKGAERFHPNVEDGYFTTRRQDVVNDTGVFNIYPGAFRYKPNPVLEVDLAIWEDNADPKNKANYYNMTMREHYEVCKFDEWEIVEEAYGLVWKRDAAGRITFGGDPTNTHVLLWRTGEDAEHSVSAKRRMADEVNKTPEEKAAELDEKYASLGTTISVDYVDDDGTDKPQSRTAKKGRR